MSERGRQLKIGIFVLVAVAMAAAGLLALGVRRGLERTLDFETYFPGSVGGLLVGSAVNLRGVRVGQVTSIGFSWIEYPGGQPDCVVVHFSVRESLRPAGTGSEALDPAVANGLRALIETEGFTGVSHLALEDVGPRKNPPLAYSWKARTTVIPSAPSQFNRLLSSAETTLNQLEKVDVDRLMVNLDQVLRAADAALENFAQLDVAGISRRMNQSLENANAAALEVRSLANAAALEVRSLANDTRQSLAQMHLDALVKDAGALIVSARETEAKLDRLVDRAAGIDVHEINQTLASARRAAQHLDDAAEELRRYPAGFLFGDAPPRVRGLDEEKR
ncbi:MAG: MCE family protein [Deltaproteobacteria bacterium]|nr:MAG: MCE family protein [Deltaproteobacteria bacterium]